MQLEHNLSPLSAAQQAWRMLWDRGRENTRTIQQTNTKKTKKRRTKREKQPNTTITQHQQTTINGDNQDHNDAEVYGDTQHAKHDNILRLGFHNIYNLSESSKTSKSRQLVDFVVHKGYDCFMMVEVGLNWRKIKAED